MSPTAMNVMKMEMEMNKRVTLNPMKPTILQCRMMCGLLNNTAHDKNKDVYRFKNLYKQLEIVYNNGRYNLNMTTLNANTHKVIKSRPITDGEFDADNDPLNNEFILTTFSKNELFDWFFKYFSPK